MGTSVAPVQASRTMARGEGGQAVVEAALVLPSIVLLLLGAIQLTQIQQARLLVDHAALAAARAGIVMNGDPGKMREAAALALAPDLGRTDSLPALAEAVVRLEAREAALAPLGLRQLRLEVHSPVAADFPKYGRHLRGEELDFDDVRPAALDATLLSLRLRYLYELKVPFANKAIHSFWMAARSAAREDDPGALALAARAGRYYLPLTAFSTMRMQSNPYLRWARR